MLAMRSFGCLFLTIIAAGCTAEVVQAPPAAVGDDGGVFVPPPTREAGADAPARRPDECTKDSECSPIDGSPTICWGYNSVDTYLATHVDVYRRCFFTCSTPARTSQCTSLGGSCREINQSSVQYCVFQRPDE